MHIEHETVYDNGVTGALTISRYSRFVLLEMRKVLEQRLDPQRTKEHEHIVGDICKIRQIAAHRTIHQRLLVANTFFIQERGDRFAAKVGTREEKLIIVAMTKKICRKILYIPGTGEDLAFAVDDEFLQVIGDRLAKTKILGVRRNLDPHVLAHPEIMVHGILAAHDDRRILIWPYPEFPELFLRNSFDMDEWSPVHDDPILL